MSETDIIRKNAGIVFRMVRGMSKPKRAELYARMRAGVIFMAMPDLSRIPSEGN